MAAVFGIARITRAPGARDFRVPIFCPATIEMINFPSSELPACPSADPTSFGFTQRTTTGADETASAFEAVTLTDVSAFRFSSNWGSGHEAVMSAAAHTFERIIPRMIAEAILPAPKKPIFNGVAMRSL